MTEGENNNSATKVQWLEDLVNYQDGSVVSREIIRRSTGTVTLFAFDEGQELSEHTAPFDALVYIVDGEACGRRSVGLYLWQILPSESRRDRDLASQPASCPQSVKQIQDAVSDDKILSFSIKHIRPPFLALPFLSATCDELSLGRKQGSIQDFVERI